MLQYNYAEICDKMILIWTDNPHANQINQNQVYFILEGKAFEYLQNNSFMLKAGSRDDEYIMIRKLLVNDFFIVYSPEVKYNQQNDFKKYQLMIDKNTLVGKICGQTFKKYFLPLIQQRWRRISVFLKKVQMLQSIPSIMLYQLSKYMSLVSVQAGTQIINRNQKNLYVYFILKGEVQYKIYNQSTIRQSPSKNYQTILTKPFKKANLKQNDIFGIDAFNADTYDQIQMQYSTQAKSNCDLYKIDKRILAIVISSFDNILPKSNKIWSSVNLNDQIQGQGYQTQDMAVLSRNVQKIKTSQKRIRDIKLRFYNTSQRNRTSKNLHNEYETQKRQETQTIQDFKYQSCQNFAQIKVSKDKNKRFYQTFNSKLKINNFPEANQTIRSKVNSIVISPYEYNQTQAEDFKNQTNKSTVKPFKTILSKRRSDSNVVTGGKQQSDIIRAYLQKKLKNQMLKKAELILQRNNQKKLKQGCKVKRIFSLKNIKNSTPVLTNKKQIGQQLYQRMNRLTENPLLSQIQGQRKKLERQTSKLKQSQVKTINIRKSTPVSNPKPIKKQELIIIQNN